MNIARARILRQSSARRFVYAATLSTAVGIIHQDSEKPKEKLSIYPVEDQPLDLVLTTSPLEDSIRTVRLRATAAYQDAHRSVQSVIDSWIGIERKVEVRAKSLVSPTEPLTPGVLYVGVATLTGSIIARSRGLPSRLFLPPTLFLLAFNHFLPQTASNVGSYAEDLESRYAPTFGEKRAIAVAHTKMSWGMLKEKTEGAVGSVQERVGTAIKWTEEATGLRLGDAFGWGNQQEKTNSQTGHATSTDSHKSV